LILTCFTPEGGSGLTDWDVYRQRNMRGGLGYTEERLRELFELRFEVLELRQMRTCANDSGYSLPVFEAASPLVDMSEAALPRKLV